MSSRNTRHANGSRRFSYQSAVLLLSVAIVVELAAIVALLTLIVTVSGGSSLPEAILIASGAFATAMLTGLALVRLIVLRR